MPAKLTKRLIESLQPREKPYEERDSELKGLLIRVEPSGLRTFWLSYTLLGRKSRYRIGVSPGVSPDGAREIAKGLAGDIARGIDPQARKKSDAAQVTKDRLSTLEAFLADRYEPYALASMKSGAQQLVRIRSDFANRLDKPMTTLTTFWAEGLRRQWKKDGAMTTAAAAAYLGVSKALLRKYRLRGEDDPGDKGPAFIRITAQMVLYERTALDDWLEARRAATSPRRSAAA